MRVILAEDSILLREGLVRLLLEEGHEVLAAVGDAEALITTLESAEPTTATTPSSSAEPSTAAAPSSSAEPSTAAAPSIPAEPGTAASPSSSEPSAGAAPGAAVESAASAADGGGLPADAGKGLPDVVVVDVRMPPTHTDEGLRAALKIRERWPAVGVLVLSQYVENSYAAQLITTGEERVGYLLKDRVMRVEEFLDALERVGTGGVAFDPDVVRQLLARTSHTDPLSRLTRRERDVLDKMAEGHLNSSIADQLFISQSAVEKHVNAIFDKLSLNHVSGYSRRVLAVLRYLGS